MKLPLVDENFTVDLPKQRLVNKLKNMRNVIRNKDNRIAKLRMRNDVPIVNLNIDGETQELKFLPLRRKVNRFLNLTKESLQKINLEQIQKISNLSDNFTNETNEEEAEDEEAEDEEEEDATD
jgi:hypothetical protein